MKTLEEEEVGIEKGSIQVILEGMIKIQVDQDQAPRASTNREIRLDVLGIGSMIILLKTVQTQIQKKNSQNRYNKCLI